MDPAFVTCVLAALFCAAVTVAVALLVSRSGRDLPMGSGDD